MKKTASKKTKKHLNFKLFSILLILCSFITIGLLIKSNLFSILTLVMISAGLLFIDFIMYKGLNSKLKVFFKNILCFFTIILIIIQILFYIFGSKAIMFLSSIIDTGIRTYTYNVYVLNDSEYKEIKDLNNKMISYIQDGNNKDMNEKLSEVIKYKTRVSDDINKLIDVILDEEVQAIVIDESYEDVLNEYNKDDFGKLRKIYSFEVTTKIKIEKSGKDLSNTPYVMYISGIDTMGKITSSARSDVNLVMAVNPNTKKVVMVSTPRDYYVELPSKGKKDKLTHAGLYGIDESVKSLSKLYDVNIDYYVRINFKSFIDVIDTLGGIEVDVEDSFCESNEERSLNKSDLICLNKGQQTLNGKQALAYARNRHAFNNGDISRGNHQMQILEAMINKAKNKDVLSKYNKIIDSMKGHVLTNVNIDDLYKLAKKELKTDDNYTVESYTPEISDMNKLADCYSIGDWANVLIGNTESVNKISNKLKEVLN